MITLRPINENNLPDILALRVAENQKGFVAANRYSVDQARGNQSLVPLGIYEGEIPVGFLMYGPDPDDGEYWICRLMTDEKYQGRGYGRKAMELAIKEIQKDRSHHKIYISFEPENTVAQKLYESMGFVSDRRVVEGEAVYRLDR